MSRTVAGALGATLTVFEAAARRNAAIGAGEVSAAENDYLRAIRRHQRRGGDSSRSAVVVSGVGCCGRAAPLRSCMEMAVGSSSPSTAARSGYREGAVDIGFHAVPAGLTVTFGSPLGRYGIFYLIISFTVPEVGAQAF